MENLYPPSPPLWWEIGAFWLLRGFILELGEWGFQDCNLGQNRWKICTPLTPKSRITLDPELFCQTRKHCGREWPRMGNWRVLAFVRFHPWFFFWGGGGGGRGGGGDNGCLLFHFILSKTWSLAFIFRVGVICGYNCNAEANQESINGGKRVLATVCF